MDGFVGWVWMRVFSEVRIERLEWMRKVVDRNADALDTV